MVKYSKILLLFIALSPLYNFAHEIRLLNQKKINQQATAIEAKITRDYYIRIALISIVAARIAYMGISYIYSTDNKPSQEVSVVPTQNDVKKEQSQKPIVPKITWGEWANNRKIAWIDWAKKVTSKENIKKNMIDISRFALASSFQTGMGFVMEGVYKKLNYPNTLRWYICSHVPYIKTIKHIKEVMVTLQDQSLTLENIHYNKQLLQDAYNRLTRDGEKLCAYMTYKTKQLDIEEQQIAERTSRYFFKYYNEFLKRIADQLAHDTIDYNALDTMLTAFETDIKGQLKLFFFIEGETDEERAMVGERIKCSMIMEHIAGLF